MSSEITNRSDGLYQIQFDTFGEKKHTTRKLLEDAKELAKNWDIDFYSKNKSLLPKGIYYSKQSSNVPFSLRIANPKEKSRSFQIASFPTVSEAKASKLKILKSLIDISL